MTDQSTEPELVDCRRDGPRWYSLKCPERMLLELPLGGYWALYERQGDE